MSLQDLPGVIGAAVVESDDGVGVHRGRRQMAGQVLGTVAHGKKGDQHGSIRHGMPSAWMLVQLYHVAPGVVDERLMAARAAGHGVGHLEALRP